MFNELDDIHKRPELFEYYTAKDLWADEHISKQMLAYHLKEDVDISSRNTEFINRSVDWITSKFNVNSSTSIIDFGCGPGLYTTRFAQKGALVTGIDFSKRSISYAQEVARKEDLQITYIDQNYLEFKTDKTFDLITMIMCDFCALSPEQRQKLLNIFRKILKPDGTVLLDVFSLETYASREMISTCKENLFNGFFAEGKYYGFQNTFKYDEEKVVLDKLTIVEKSRTKVIYNWLQYFSKESIEKELNDNGFVVEDFYSDVAGSPFDEKNLEFAVVVKKSS